MTQAQFTRKVDELLAREPGKLSIEQAIAIVASGDAK